MTSLSSCVCVPSAPCHSTLYLPLCSSLTISFPQRKHPHLDNLPSLYVALKADRDRSTQRTPLQPHDYTAALAFPPPLHVSVTWDSISELFVQLAEAATYPSTAFPAPKDGEGGGVVWGTLAGVDRTVWLGAAVGVCASAVTGWVVYRRYSRG